MRHLKLFRWTAALMVAIALAPAAASAQEDGTVTISGLFSMDYLSGETDLDIFLPGLVEVYFNGHEHTWTLTLHGTTQSHSTNGAYYATGIQATSFDLEFFGPDAVALNGLVSDHLAGGHLVVGLQNTYDDNGGGFAIMNVSVYGDDGGPGTSFYTRQDIGSDTLFPTDVDGYPVVGPEPFSIEPDYTELAYLDMSSSTGGMVGSLAGLVTFQRSVGAGDFNGDNVVDAADYVVWRKTDGTPDGYNTWRTNFARTYFAGTGASDVHASANSGVPEPTSVQLLLLAAVGFAAMPRDRVVANNRC